MSIEDLEFLLQEKEQVILDEIEYKKLLLRKVQLIKENCEKIKQYLGKYTVKEMKPLEVKGEIKDVINYNEYEILRENSENLKKAVTLTALRRVISFNEEGMIGDKFIIVREVEDFHKDIEGEIIAHENCLYTIIEDGRWSTDGENIDNKVEASLRKIAIKNDMNFLELFMLTYYLLLMKKILNVYS